MKQIDLKNAFPPVDEGFERGTNRAFEAIRKEKVMRHKMKYTMLAAALVILALAGTAVAAGFNVIEFFAKEDERLEKLAPDHPFVYWITYSYAGDLLESGARCYCYEEGFLHAKGMVVDGIVSCYGTANMDIRSFDLDFEVNAVIYSPEVTMELEKIFLDDLTKCSEITKYDYAKRSMIIRIKEQVSRLLAPLM